MKLSNINAGQQSSSVRREGGVYIDPNMIKEKVMLDIDGNEIDPRTKQIIKRNTDNK